MLLGVGAAAGAVLLDGCGAGKPRPARNPEVNGVDADLLDEVFMLENMSIAAYAHIAGSTPELHDYGFPAVADGQAALAFVAGIENKVIGGYIDVVPKLTNAAVRAFAVSIMANEAQHLALVTQARGLPPTGEAIVRGSA